MSYYLNESLLSGTTSPSPSPSPPRQRQFPPSFLTSARMKEIDELLSAPLATQTNKATISTALQRALAVESPQRVIVSKDQSHPGSPILTTTVTTHVHTNVEEEKSNEPATLSLTAPTMRHYVLPHSQAHRTLLPLLGPNSTAEIFPQAPTMRVCPLAKSAVHFESLVGGEEACANTKAEEEKQAREGKDLPLMCIHSEVYVSSDRCAIVNSLNLVSLMPTLRVFWKQFSINGDVHSAHIIPFSCPSPPSLKPAHGVATPSTSLSQLLGEQRSGSNAAMKLHANLTPVAPIIYLLYFQTAEEATKCAKAHPNIVFPVSPTSPTTTFAGIRSPSAASTARYIRLQYSRSEHQFVVPPQVTGQTEVELMKSVRNSFTDMQRYSADSTNVALIFSPTKEREYESIAKLKIDDERSNHASTYTMPSSKTVAASLLAASGPQPTNAAPRRIAPPATNEQPARAPVGQQRMLDQFSASASMYHSTNEAPANPLTVSFLDDRQPRPAPMNSAPAHTKSNPKSVAVESDTELESPEPNQAESEPTVPLIPLEPLPTKLVAKRTFVAPTYHNTVTFRDSRAWETIRPESPTPEPNANNDQGANSNLNASSNKHLVEASSTQRVPRTVPVITPPVEVVPPKPAGKSDPFVTATNVLDRAASPPSQKFCVLLPLLHHFDSPKEPFPEVDPRLCHETLDELAQGDNNIICPHQVAHIQLRRIAVVHKSVITLSSVPKMLLGKDAETEQATGFWKLVQIRSPTSDSDGDSSIKRTRERGYVVHPLYFTDSASSVDLCVLMFQDLDQKDACLAAYPNEVYGVAGLSGSNAHSPLKPLTRYIDIVFSKRDGRFILPPRLYHALIPRGRLGEKESNPSPSDQIFNFIHIIRKESIAHPASFQPVIRETTVSERIQHGLGPHQSHWLTTTDDLEQPERLAQSLHRLQQFSTSDPQLESILSSSSSAHRTAGGLNQSWIQNGSKSTASDSGVPLSQSSFASRSYSSTFRPFSSQDSNGASSTAALARDQSFRHHLHAYPVLIEEFPPPLPDGYPPEMPLDHILANLTLPQPPSDPTVERRHQAHILESFQHDTNAVFHSIYHKKYWWPYSGGKSFAAVRADVEEWLREVDYAYRNRTGKDIALSILRLDADCSFAISFLRCGRVQHVRVVYDLDQGSSLLSGTARLRGRFRILGQVLPNRPKTKLAKPPRGLKRIDGENSEYTPLSDVTYSSFEAIFPRSFNSTPTTDGECTDFTFPPLVGTTPSLSSSDEINRYEMELDSTGHSVRRCAPVTSPFPYAPLHPATPTPDPAETDTPRRAKDEYYEEYVEQVLHNAEASKESPAAHYRSVRRREAEMKADEEEAAAEKKRQAAQTALTTRDQYQSTVEIGKGTRLDFSPPHRNAYSSRIREQNAKIADEFEEERQKREEFYAERARKELEEQSARGLGEFKARTFSKEETFSPLNLSIASQPTPKSQPVSTLKSNLSRRNQLGSPLSPSKQVRFVPEVQESPPTRQPAPPTHLVTHKAIPSTATLVPASAIANGNAPTSISYTATTTSTTTTTTSSTVGGATISNLNPTTVSQLLEPHLRKNLTLDTTSSAMLKFQSFANELVWQALPLRERKNLTHAEGAPTIRARIEQYVSQAVNQFIRSLEEEGGHTQPDTNAHRSIVQHANSLLSPPHSQPPHLAQTPLTPQALTAATARLSPTQVTSVAACFGGDSALAFEHLIGRTYFACTRNRPRVEEWLKKQQRDCTIIRLGSEEGSLSLSFVIAGDVQHIRLRFDVVSNYFHLVGHHSTKDSSGQPITVDLSHHYFATIPELVAATGVYSFPPLWSPNTNNKSQPPTQPLPSLNELQAMKPLVLRTPGPTPLRST